jgi:hypothetical protein
MFTSRLFVVVSLGVTLLGTVGCGGSMSNCQVVGLKVGPPTAAVNHTATAPGNSQTFNAIDQFSGPCLGPVAVTPALINSNWTASDPSVHLSASPSGQVTATCTAAVTNPVTITATAADGSGHTGQASLTCN